MARGPKRRANADDKRLYVRKAHLDVVGHFYDNTAIYMAILDKDPGLQGTKSKRNTRITG
jgi:hypothetical protein